MNLLKDIWTNLVLPYLSPIDLCRFQRVSKRCLQLTTTFQSTIDKWKQLINNRTLNECLYEAGKSGHLQMVEFCIAKGANQLYRGMEGAAENGHEHLVPYFIDRASNDHLTAQNWIHGLNGASKGDHERLVDFFISKGINSRERYMALHNAASNCNQAMVDKLIANGADDWESGLEGACKGGNLTLVKLFLEKCTLDHGHDDYDDDDDSDANSMLSMALRAAAEGGNTDIIDYLIKLGADDWNYGLFGAVEGNHSHLVDFFIQKGANDWNWALRAAVSIGSKHYINMFVQLGANDWSPALEDAIKHGDIELFKYVLAKGAKLQSNAIMFEAISGGHKKIIEMLHTLEWIEDKNHDLEICALFEEHELIEMFISFGANDFVGASLFTNDEATLALLQRHSPNLL
jgi:hypothetical protein